MDHREISKLKANPDNPRGKVVIDDSLRELAASIESQGVLQPILITPEGMIVAGHRRTKAAELAGLSSVPVIVREMTETQQIQIMLIENLQREDLSVLQTAQAYKALTDRGLSIREIAKAIGWRNDTVSRHLDILRLTPRLHGYYEDESRLPLGAVPHLLKLPAYDQVKIARQAAEQGWTITRIVEAVRSIKAAPANGHEAKTQDAKPTKLQGIVDKLETIDDGLDGDPRLRKAQSLLRQAMNEILDVIMAKRRIAHPEKY